MIILLWCISWVISPLFYIVCLIIYRGNLRAYAERIGCIAPNHHPHIWIHAASVGEIRGLYKVVEILSQQHCVHITVMTRLGLREAKNLYKNINNIRCTLAAFDIAPCVMSLRNNINPSLYIIAEADMWIMQMQSLSCPIVVINGYISDRRLKFIHRFNAYHKFLSQSIACALAATQLDNQRFQSIGIASHYLVHSKYDALIPTRRITTTTKSDILFISVHKEEMEALIPIIDALKTYKLVIAPRYPDETEYFQKHLEPYGKVTIYPGVLDLSAQIVLIRAIGYSQDLIDKARIVFVGGSLSEKCNGHNFLEPMLQNKPTFIGPYLGYFLQLAGPFFKQGVLIKTSGAQEMIQLLNNHDSYTKITQKINHIMQEYRGVSQRAVDILSSKGFI